jgi:hypothetical protein
MATFVSLRRASAAEDSSGCSWSMTSDQKGFSPPECFTTTMVIWAACVSVWQMAKKDQAGKVPRKAVWAQSPDNVGFVMSRLARAAGVRRGNSGIS